MHNPEILPVLRAYAVGKACSITAEECIFLAAVVLIAVLCYLAELLSDEPRED